MAAALQRDAPPGPNERSKTVAARGGCGDAPAGGRGAGARLAPCPAWRGQDEERRAAAGGSKVEAAAHGEAQGRLDDAGHHAGPGVGAQHLLQCPQRILVGAGLDENEPARIEPGLGKTTAVGPPEMTERTAGCDQEGGAARIPSPRKSGERARVRGSRTGNALQEGHARRVRTQAACRADVERLEPLAAPHPIPLPVALGTLVARSCLWMARERRGEGVPCRCSHRHESSDKTERGRPVPVGCTEHLMQHAASETGRRQLRVDLGDTQRQARSGPMSPLPLKPRQLHAQRGEPGAPVRARGQAPRVAGDVRCDVRCWKHWSELASDRHKNKNRTKSQVRPVRARPHHSPGTASAAKSRMTWS
jgi:hypothetical protein